MSVVKHVWFIDYCGVWSVDLAMYGVTNEYFMGAALIVGWGALGWLLDAYGYCPSVHAQRLGPNPCHLHTTLVLDIIAWQPLQCLNLVMFVTKDACAMVGEVIGYVVGMPSG